MQSAIIGIDGQNITIVTDPPGTPVDGQPNTFDYPILTSVTLMCMATTADGSPANVTSYYWNAVNCYSHTDNVNCFYSGSHKGQNLTGNDLLVQDAGTVVCIATIGNTNYTSGPLTLCISGELQLHMYIRTYVNISYCNL